jgi:hypothetical protein
MANYISSNANRFYAAVEASYGQAASVSAANRFPAVRLQAQQLVETGRRLDKTGTRTFLGSPMNGRRHTAFQTRTYLTSWGGTVEPSYGSLFQAALGGPGQLSSGLVIASVQNLTELHTVMPHGLSSGSGVSFNNELRFVTGAPDASTLVINAPFSTTPGGGAILTSAITYKLSTALPSLTLYDYWDPITAVSRMVTGAAVDSLEISINGDYHEFVFNGPAADILDSANFSPGVTGLSSFPQEPVIQKFDYSIVPGHLGQVWLGNRANRFYTLTEASIGLGNNLEIRSSDFGSSYPRAIAPGMRVVSSNFTLLAQDDLQTAGLYAAAKQRSPIAAMLQLGQQQGQLMGIFLPGIVPEIPNYKDSETRLLWEFKHNRAQGSSDDEISIAFA